MSLPKRCSGRDGPETFTFKTLADRMPVILTKVIDQLSRSLNDLVAKNGPEARTGVKDALSRLTKLKRDLVTDKALEALEDSLPDAKLWKDAMSSMAGLTWHSAPWLYSECYMYRAIHSAIEQSPSISGYDPFRVEKEAAFHSALPGMVSVAEFLQSLVSDLEKTDGSGVEVVTSLQSSSLQYLILLSLWGNRVDLSLLAKAASNASDEVSALQAVSLEQLNDLQHLVLASDLEPLTAHLLKARAGGGGGETRRLDIVLDNSGFELFTDLCLVHYLLVAKLVDSVRLHCKTMPWFVSDSLPADVAWTLEQLAAHASPALAGLGRALREHVAERRIVVAEHAFYTLPYEYGKMRRVCPGLYEQLGEAYLVVLKGDLNYRKLVADRRWPHTTGFRDALGAFAPSSVCALRTLKAETVVGLVDGRAERAQAADADWLHSGKYAVIQLLSAASAGSSA